MILFNSVHPYNEPELLAALRNGSENAFTSIYHHYSVPLYHNILSLVKDGNTAEELVQDIFSKIWKQRESIAIEKNFAGYLFVMARNRVFDFFQQATRDKILYEKIKIIASEQYDHIEQALFAKENADLLRKAIAALPPQRRKAFELCKLEGLTYRQASEEMGISLSTLKDHMVNALEAIRTYISKNVEVAGMLAFYCICTQG
ncbi:MAG: RNA polymerase sigma-70 factor [Chitinophagaceae bacterium]|nr:RNA polymerase sigma-70 factor [Chitinophagaceae bacterium]